MSSVIKCPLCGDDMPLTQLKSRPNGREGKTYIWICDECPGLLVEWWGGADTEALVKYLDHHEGVLYREPSQWEKDELKDGVYDNGN